MPQPTPALAFALAALITLPTHAAYRCDGGPGEAPTYSQLPCGHAARAVRTDDARTAAQVRDARDRHDTAQREARRYDRRIRQEATARRDERATAIDGPVRQVDQPTGKTAGARTATTTATDDRHAGTVVRSQRVFKARVPKQERDMRYPVRP
jgi:hypothetical protein